MKYILFFSLIVVSGPSVCMMANSQYLSQNKDAIKTLIQSKRAQFKGLKKNSDKIVESYAENSLKKKTAQYEVIRNTNMSAMVYSCFGGVFLQMLKNVLDAKSNAYQLADFGTAFAAGIFATYLYKHLATPVPNLQNVMNAKLLALENTKNSKK